MKYYLFFCEFWFGERICQKAAAIGTLEIGDFVLLAAAGEYRDRWAETVS
jgi:hypothetical protein